MAGLCDLICARALPTRCRATAGEPGVVTTRARWRVGASLDSVRSKECFGESSSDEFDDSDENAGVKGKSSESGARVSGLSARVECVGAGESGKVRSGDMGAECRGDAAEGDESSAGVGESLDEDGDDGVSGRGDDEGDVEGRDFPWSARARRTV